MRLGVVVIVATFGMTACLTAATATEIPSPEVTVEVGPFIEPTATPVCQHADGVTLTLYRVNDSRVEVQVSGLQPGEKSFVIHSTSTRTQGLMGESGIFVEGADENGEFSYELAGLLPLEGESTATWDIRFIHRRGVECATITLP